MTGVSVEKNNQQLRLEKYEQAKQTRASKRGGENALLKGFALNKGRQTNKLSLEQLVKLKSDNFDATALDTTLEVAKTRGSTLGLPLANFVRSQLRYEQERAMEDVLQRARTALGTEPQAKAGEIISKYW